MDELRELITLMRENGLAELELEREEFRVRLRRDSEGGPGQLCQHRPRLLHLRLFTLLHLRLLPLPQPRRIPEHKRRQPRHRIRIYTLSLHQSWARSTDRRLRTRIRL